MKIRKVECCRKTSSWDLFRFMRFGRLAYFDYLYVNKRIATNNSA